MDGDKRTAVAGEAGPFRLPSLPYALDALEPALSREAVQLHHDTHHRGYVRKLNALVEGTAFASMPLDQVVRATAGRPERQEIFNNAGQAWNHAFFFEGLRPPRPVLEVPAVLHAKIDVDLDGMDAMALRFAKLAVERFGSGWVWMSLRSGRLEISSSAGADSPLTSDATPLLAVDVWEHAYYLDYHERREAYVKALVPVLVDWSVVARRARLE